MPVCMGSLVKEAPISLGYVLPCSRVAAPSVLEDEVTEFAGRAKSQQWATVDASPGYRNGYGKMRLVIGDGHTPTGACAGEGSLKCMR